MNRQKYQIKRERNDLKGLCLMCGSREKMEVHHVRKFSKSSKRKDYLTMTMARIDRKQIPLCQKCHKAVHCGIYDGEKL